MHSISWKFRVFVFWGFDLKYFPHRHFHSHWVITFLEFGFSLILLFWTRWVAEIGTSWKVKRGGPSLASLLSGAKVHHLFGSVLLLISNLLPTPRFSFVWNLQTPSVTFGISENITFPLTLENRTHSLSYPVCDLKGKLLGHNGPPKCLLTLPIIFQKLKLTGKILKKNIKVLKVEHIGEKFDFGNITSILVHYFLWYKSAL